MQQRIVKLVNWLTLISTVVAVIEKGNHYVQVYRKSRYRKSHPIGFQQR